jgi:hypothetical protein
MWSIKYDTTELVGSTYNVSFARDDTTAQRNINFIESSGVDGATILNDRFGTKIIEIRGILVAASASALQTAIDTANELFSRKDKNLDIQPDGGSVRRYVCRLIGSVEYDREHYNNDFVPFRVRFFVSDGVGKATSSTNAHSDLNTAAERRPAANSDTATFVGSAKPLPVASFTLDTLGKLDLIKLQDDDFSKELAIEVDQNYASNDIIEVDFNGQSVSRNRGGTKTAMSYRGEFPDWVIGGNDFHIDFQGATLVQDVNQYQSGSNTYLGNAGGVKRVVCQSFVPTESGYLYQIKLRLAKNGSPGDLVVYVYSDNGGKPYQPLADTGSNFFRVLEAAIPASETLTAISVTGTNPYYLRKGVKYWLVLRNTLDSVDNIIYLYGKSTSAYASGEALRAVSNTIPTDPVDWVAETDTPDIAFETYRGQGGAINWQVDVSIDYTKRYL